MSELSLNLRPYASEDLDLMRAFTVEPPPREYVIPGLSPGSVGALVAAGGTGKSFFALESACAIACPKADLLNIQPSGSGSVLYLSLEDPADELSRRLFAMAAHWDQNVRECVAENLVIKNWRGRDLDVMERANKLRPSTTDELTKLAEGHRLVIFDTLVRCHRRNENDNGEMSGVIRQFELIAERTGAAVVYVHHTSKGAQLSGQGGVATASRGASCITDNARWVGNLVTMTPDEAEKYSDRKDGPPIGPERRTAFVQFTNGKLNYGQDDGPRWYFREKGGVLIPAKLQATTKGRGGKSV